MSVIYRQYGFLFDFTCTFYGSFNSDQIFFSNEFFAFHRLIKSSMFFSNRPRRRRREVDAASNQRVSARWWRLPITNGYGEFIYLHLRFYHRRTIYAAFRYHSLFMYETGINIVIYFCHNRVYRFISISTQKGVVKIIFQLCVYKDTRMYN